MWFMLRGSGCFALSGVLPAEPFQRFLGAFPRYGVPAVEFPRGDIVSAVAEGGNDPSAGRIDGKDGVLVAMGDEDGWLAGAWGRRDESEGECDDVVEKAAVGQAQAQGVRCAVATGEKRLACARHMRRYRRLARLSLLIPAMGV